MYSNSSLRAIPLWDSHWRHIKAYLLAGPSPTWLHKISYVILINIYLSLTKNSTNLSRYPLSLGRMGRGRGGPGMDRPPTPARVGGCLCWPPARARGWPRELGGGAGPAGLALNPGLEDAEVRTELFPGMETLRPGPPGSPMGLLKRKKYYFFRFFKGSHFLPSELTFPSCSGVWLEHCWHPRQRFWPLKVSFVSKLVKDLLSNLVGLLLHHLIKDLYFFFLEKVKLLLVFEYFPMQKRNLRMLVC